VFFALNYIQATSSRLRESSRLIKRFQITSNDFKNFMTFADDSSPSHPPLLQTSTSHCPEPASPAATEIAYDIGRVEQLSEGRIETLRPAVIKVRDFAYELMTNSSKVPEVFNRVPCLIAADWHVRNPHKNHGLLSPKPLFRLIKMGNTHPFAARMVTSSGWPCHLSGRLSRQGVFRISPYGLLG
jgi:hypothetical protein